MKLEPEFVHDCDDCVFLGTIKRSEMVLVTDEVCAALTAHIEGKATLKDLTQALGTKPPEVWDLYVCGRVASTLGPSLIARYGHAGPGYKSMPASIAEKLGDPFENDEEIALALKLAKSAGLIPMCGVTGDVDDDD